MIKSGIKKSELGIEVGEEVENFVGCQIAKVERFELVFGVGLVESGLIEILAFNHLNKLFEPAMSSLHAQNSRIYYNLTLFKNLKSVRNIIQR